MSKVKHWKLQREQDFRALRNYRKSIPGALLETINGADHSTHLLERFQKENNYMSKKCGHKQNLMTVKRLLTRIAKYADEPTKRLKEAQQVIKSNFPMVQGMPSGDKCTPEFAMRVLIDCDGNLIDCDHQEYGKEQNIGLHDAVSPVAMVFTCLCNYNTEICGMAMAQTVVPIYTIPNTYRVQQSLWENLCWIIPGVTRTSGSKLRSFEPVAPRNTPVGQSDTAPGARSSGDSGTGIVGLGNLQNVAVSLPTCEKERRMSLRKHASPAFRMESLRPVPIGPCLNDTYLLSILPMMGILLIPICQKPALPSKLLRNLGNAIPKRNLTFPK